jgi:hypothetical protein
MLDSPSAIEDHPPRAERVAAPNVFARLRKWWRKSRFSSSLSVPYAVPCVCGRVLEGFRKRRPQGLRCPACGKTVFVLARSPLPLPKPPGDAGEARAAAPKGTAPSRRRPAWHWPTLAALITLAGVASVFMLLLPRLGREVPGSVPSGEEIQERMASGRRALAEGKFTQAVKELDDLLARANRRGGTLTRDERRQVVQLRRQSEMLALLQSMSLEDILRQAAANRDDDEWQAKFDKDYRGRSVIFDDEVGGAEGQPALRFYVVRAGDATARVALEDLELLRDWPLEPPRRVLFGARLAAVKREEGGRWVVRFEPDSGVFLTDEGAAGTCCPGPLDDELRDVLWRQKQWTLSR